MTQVKLPSLPVPELDQSCEKYLKSVKPFLSDSEYRETQFIVDTFRTGIGKRLQEKLKTRAETRKNWLSDWWLDIYGAYRGPLPFFSNFGGCTPIIPPKQGSQIIRAAWFTHSLIQKYLMIQHKKWPQQFSKKGAPLDMQLYHGLYATSRMPGIEGDTFLNYSLKDGKPTMENRHIVVIQSKRFYTFDVLTKNLKILSPPEIKRQLHRINAMAEAKPLCPGVGALTANDRVTWKKVQDHMFALDAKNKDFVDIINKSLFILVLDDHEPSSASKAAYESYMGDCSNRWFDKEMQAIIFKNGYIGSNNDHAHIDGYISADLYQRSLDDTKLCEGEWKGSSTMSFLPQPTELEFTVDDFVVKEIEIAEEKHNVGRNQYDVVDEPFCKFGKRFAKDQSVHPDALIQMAIQLAYYNLHKRSVATYETATTRQFQDGRTETVRSCTLESQRFVQAMCSSSTSTSTKISLLREACENQTRMMNECCDGQGIDRHLIGLKIISQEEGLELPEIFKDKAWTLSGGDGNFILSTSLGGYQQVHGGLGPMTQNGYGIFYTIENERIQLIVSSFGTPETNASKMWSAVDKALCDVRDLLLVSKL